MKRHEMEAKRISRTRSSSIGDDAHRAAGGDLDHRRFGGVDVAGDSGGA